MRSKNNFPFLHQIRQELIYRLCASYRGLRLWKKLRRMGRKKQIAILLIPQGDAEISDFALIYLSQMLQDRKLEKAIIITDDPRVIESQRGYEEYILEIKLLTTQEIEDLLQLCCLYQFDDNFIVASLDRPYGRRGNSFIGVKGISKEEIFAVGVYGIYPISKSVSDKG